MKYFSDKCGPKMTSNFSGEFAAEFFEIENAYVQTELAGGPISQKVIDSKADLAHIKSVPL